MTASMAALQQACSSGPWAPHHRASPWRRRRQEARCRAAHRSSHGGEQQGKQLLDAEDTSLSSSTRAGGAQPPIQLQRRVVLSSAAAAAAAACIGAAAAPPASASKLPEALDRAWEGLGGGPADLLFPDSFLGVWDVESVLSSVETPLGPEFVPDMRVVQRARQEDLNAVVRYQVAFMRNGRGEVVPDRSFNTASLMQAYTGMPVQEVQQRIQWTSDDPNELQLSLPGGLQVATRVTRRSEERQDGERLSTSEYFQQLIFSPQQAQPKVKASQCFTKYHWRSAEQAAASGGGGVQIVATQLVSDYLTAYDDAAAMMEAKGRPVAVFTYKMRFRRPAGSPSLS